VLVGSLLEGFPGAIPFLGFLFALAAIWLISQEDGKDNHFLARLSDLRLPLLAGIGFGLFFILMDIAARDTTLWPMLASRAGGVLIVAIYMLFRRDSWRLGRDLWPILMLNTFLDVGGTALYVFASQAGRLDVAAVISSLFPGTTVILAALLLKERVSRSQSVGILLALTAIVLLTL
jgi:drug/metabolite transporter (DMT)-like permease